MERSELEKLAFKDLRALKDLVDEVLEAKRTEAVDEYRERARVLAQEYGFKVGAGIAGRPPKKTRKSKKSDGEAVGDQPLPAE